LFHKNPRFASQKPGFSFNHLFMKNIPFKARPEYSFKFFRPTPTSPEQIMHTKYFRENFATERLPGSGITKKELFIMPAGIHVMHSQIGKAKLVKKEIRRAFGSMITSTRHVNKRDTATQVYNAKKK
jgi:hypothetical protein